MINSDSEDIEALKERIRVLEDKNSHLRSRVTLGDILGGVIHDSNNHLSGVCGALHLLERNIYGDFDPEKVDRYFKIIRLGLENISSLSKQVVALSKKTPYTEETLYLNNIVNDFCPIIESTFRKTISITQKLASLPSTKIKGDRNQISNALMNLAINSRDAILSKGSHGSIEISTDLVKLNSYKFLDFEPISGNYVSLTLSDTGLGISDDNLESIFQLYFSTKGNKGSGIGIHSVVETMKRHSGSLKLSSISGFGTSMSLYFPLDSSSEHSFESNSFLDDKVGSEDILLVDDDLDFGEIMFEYLTTLGYSVNYAKDGVNALELFKSNNYDLVISNLDMAPLDGVELFKELEVSCPQKYSSCKLMLTTGYDCEKLKNKLSKYNLIQKPFGLPKASHVIREILDS